jgi:hypothetical protein
MEVMSDLMAQKRGLNRQNRSLEEVQELLCPMIGRRIEVTVSGVFLVPIDEIPEESLIRPVFFSKKQGKFKLKTTGMDFEIDGTSVPYLSWMIVEETVVRVDLMTRLRGKIDEDYLDRFFRLLDSAFRTYVFGETPNEPGS